MPTEDTTITTELETTPTISSTPPVDFVRNEFGLYSHINHEFNEDGTVNWRKMIKPEFLVVNKENFERFGKPVPATIEGVEDKDLIILLGGIKQLAKLRGYNSLNHIPVLVTPSYVGVRTVINWIPNYETDQRPVIFESMADAHPNNVADKMRPYLATVAENRGFVRAVRNFLGVNIVGREELNADEKIVTESTTGKVIESLQRVLEANSIPFESWVNRMQQEGEEGAENWTSYDDIPLERVLSLIEKTNKRIEEKNAKKKLKKE